MLKLLNVSVCMFSASSQSKSLLYFWWTDTFSSLITTDINTVYLCSAYIHLKSKTDVVRPFTPVCCWVRVRVRVSMTKPKNTKKDKGSGDDISDDQTKLACVGGASGSTSNPSATNKDILAAINKLSGAVDVRFIELNSSISNLRAALSDICDRVASTEATAESHGGRISELEKKYDGLAALCSQQQAKLEDLEARSHRQNIRIVGIPEKAENGKPLNFIIKLLPQLLGEDNFNRPIEVDRAHRSPTQAKDGKTRAIIVKLHYFQEKERVLRLAREKGSLQYDGRPVFIFPDLTSTVMKKRQAFQVIREKCRSNGIRYGFRLSSCRPREQYIASSLRTGLLSRTRIKLTTALQPSTLMSINRREIWMLKKWRGFSVI
uniref:L1 transposable element RRM domain-containing protein n=1 Tax=Kryptolebias marmoratus TaxID=37003 RepID=A0A3Q3ACX0_KRYMA